MDSRNAIAIASASIAVAIAGLGCVHSANAADAPAKAAAISASAPVEVQINLCTGPTKIAKALGLKAKSDRREVWYFDTPGLTLMGKGLVVRLRVSDGDDELTLKFADQNCAAIPARLLPKGAGKCEYDLHGTSLKGAVSLEQTLSAPTLRVLRDASRSPAEAVNSSLNQAQITFLREQFGVWPLPADIRRLGPATLKTYRSKFEPFVVESWNLATSERFVEISQKTTYGKADAVKSALTARLASAGIEVCGDQSSQALPKLKALSH